jgi:hypothetical protein
MVHDTKAAGRHLPLITFAGAQHHGNHKITGRAAASRNADLFGKMSATGCALEVIG